MVGKKGRQEVLKTVPQATGGTSTATSASAAKPGTRKPSKRWALALVALAVVGLFLVFSNLFKQAPTPSAPEDIAQILQGARVVESETEVFSREVAPLVCEGSKDLVYWRELRTYNVTKTDVFGRVTTSYYSTITLSVENKGNQTIQRVLLAERIPSTVARVPEEILNYTVKPVAVKVGSVVVEWMFEQVQPGEKKEVSYTVEKKLSKEALAGFEAPRIITQAIEAGASPTPTPQQAGFDYSTIAIVAVILLAGSLAYYFLKKRGT